MSFDNPLASNLTEKIERLAGKLTHLQRTAHALISEIRNIKEIQGKIPSDRGGELSWLLPNLKSTSDHWHRYLIEDADIWRLREKQLTWGSCCRLVNVSLNTLDAVLEASSAVTCNASQERYLRYLDPDYPDLLELRNETLCRKIMWRDFYFTSNRYLLECYCLACAKN